MRVVALAGGVGAGKFLRGLALAMDPSELTVVVNTGDDIRLHGLHISPDLDSVTYWLADAMDRERGWGRRGESFRAMEALRELDAERAWFNLGDRDLATHLLRTQLLAEGMTLSEATERVAAGYGVAPRILPMSDDRIETHVEVLASGQALDLHFQDYWVRRHAQDDVKSVRYEGIAAARPAPGVLEAIAQADVIVICPSNPVASIGPILGVPGLREALAERRAVVAGVSPIVGGAPLAGMADKLMPVAGLEVSALGAARAYAGLIGSWVIDEIDRGLAPSIESELGVRVAVTDTIMTGDDVAARSLAPSWLWSRTPREAAPVTVELLPLRGLPEISAGDDLGALLAEALAPLEVRDDDVVVVTQKIVSKAEGRMVADDGTDWVASETRRVVARRGDLVIAETRHGFVCANAGVDVSNVPEGFVALLPEDPDGSAERLRAEVSRRLGVSPAVVITDTFGRAWRQGVVNVAIGCAGLPAVVDLRGTGDHFGRELTATVVAFADEVAAASGLVMGKDARVPAAVVRGLEPGEASRPGTAPGRAADGRAADLLRTPQEDLFRTSPLEAVSSWRPATSFGPGSVPRAVIEEAVRAACTMPAPHASRPWLFVVLDAEPAKRLLLAAINDAWAADLAGGGIEDAEIERRLAHSNEVLGSAPVLIVPAVDLGDARSFPDILRAGAERDSFVLAAGAAIQHLKLALAAQTFASCWAPSTAFCREQTRAVLGLGEQWEPMGLVAAGPEPEAGPLPAQTPEDPAPYLRFL